MSKRIDEVLGELRHVQRHADDLPTLDDDDEVTKQDPTIAMLRSSRQDDLEVVRIEVEEIARPFTWVPVVRAIGFVQLLILAAAVLRGCG